MRFAPVPEPTERQLIEHGYLSNDEQQAVSSELKKTTYSAEIWAQILGMETSYRVAIRIRGFPGDKARRRCLFKRLLNPFET